MLGVSNHTWGLAIGALRANKVKAGLTMLGVVIGSACIVLVVTVALLGRTYVLAQIEAVGSNLVYAYLQRDPANPASISDAITQEDMQAIQQLPHVKAAAGTYDVPTTIVINGVERPVNLIGVTQDFQKIRNLMIVRGRFFDELDMQNTAKACLISQDLARRFNGEDMIGKQLRVGELTFTVIAVFRERIATFGQSEITPETVLIPAPLLKYYTGNDNIKTLYAQADDSQNVDRVTEEVQRALVQRHRASAAYFVQNLGGILDAARKISFALTAVLMLVGWISLVISGVGIMNIMLVTVTQRTREIGLRMAIGARRKEILYQFLIEALLISGVGAIIGILIACSLKLLVQPLLPPEYGLRIPISNYSMVAAFVVSCATGITFGYLPASRASKLEPTESLRYE